MSYKKLRFAIFGNIYQAKKSAPMDSVLRFLKSRDAEIIIDSEFRQFISEVQGIDVNGMEPITGDDFTADFAISMGGDGTFLKAAARVGSKNIPIIGVKMGRLGFLADVESTEIDAALTAIYDGEYSIEEREAIEVTAPDTGFGVCNCGINDVAILKQDTASMITIRAAINGEYLNTYQADGLIISTSTGSTAYSLSNGGPIIVPGTDVFAITAVAPHSLNIRPIVVSAASVITLEVESRSGSFLVAIDGRSEHCTTSSVITLRRAPYSIKVVKRNAGSYFSTLRGKMMWGADTRKD